MWLLVLGFLLLDGRLAGAFPASPRASAPGIDAARGSGELPDPGHSNVRSAWLRLRVLFEIEPGTGITSIGLARILDEVRRIWQPYLAIDAAGALPDSWVSPDPGSDDTVHLVLTNRFSPRRAESDPLPIAWTALTDDGVPGDMLSASVEAVQRILWPSRWAGRPVREWPAVVRDRLVTHALARAIAHEIGHYVLRSRNHSERGLMRPIYSPDDLMTESLDRFALQPSDVWELRRRVVLLRHTQPAGMPPEGPLACHPA